jgi:hypothetical protein
MRLWSLHPKYLDSKGLVALWREGLLAYAVLKGRTRGYTRHPQLERFKRHPKPLQAIRAYLHTVCDEADRRGYEFNRSKLDGRTTVARSRVTLGQLEHEMKHLRAKLRRRDRRAYQAIRKVKRPEAHPLFKVVRGEIETWEKRRSISSAKRVP